MDIEEQNLKLVKEVGKRPELYDYKIPEYSKTSLTEKSWQKVADVLKIPVSECKERWNNLKSDFIRKLKSPEEGSDQKACYLEDAMKFYLPFINSNNSSPTSGDMPLISENSPDSPQIVTEENVDSLETCDDNTFQLTFPILSSPASAQSSSTNLPVTIAQLQQTNSEASQQTNPQASQQRKDMPANFTLPAQLANKLIIIRKKVPKSTTPSKKPKVTDHQYVADNHIPIKPKVQMNGVGSSSKKIDRHHTVKMFLLSLMPELEGLSDYQIKLFKRKVLFAIDEVSDCYQ